MAAGAEESTSGDARAAINQRIAEIRSAGFTPSRRGYDRDEVQRYLGALADWLEGLGLGDPDRGEMRRELAWVGERTSEILTKAEETASEMREQAAREAAQLRADAERIGSEAEEQARHVQLEAVAQADAAIAAAERRAEELLEEAARRREDLQTLIGDLLERRDEIIADGNRLVDELAELFATADEDSFEEEDGEGEELEDELDEELEPEEEPLEPAGETVESAVIPPNPDTEEHSPSPR